MAYKKKKLNFKHRQEKRNKFQAYHCRADIANKRMRVGGRFLPKTVETDILSRFSRSDSEEPTSMQELNS